MAPIEFAPRYVPGAGVVNVLRVALEAYRSCSWREKREVLAVFWRGKLSANATINSAALEYGRIAIVIAIALELIPIYVVSLSRGFLPGELALGVEVVTMLSLAKAIFTYRTLNFARSELTS